LLLLCAAWDHQMQTGVKKREELHEKYQEKFKELGVSQFNVVDNLL